MRRFLTLSPIFLCLVVFFIGFGESPVAFATNTPPLPPTLVTATPLSTSNSLGVVVTWNAAIPTDPTASITRSYVYRTDPQGNQSQVCSVASTVFTCTDTDISLAPNVPYAYQVRVRDTNGTFSNYSTPAVTTVNDTTPPSSPSNLVASGVTTSSVTVSWASSSDNVGISQYTITFFDAGNHQVGTQYSFPSLGSALSVSQLNLVPGTSYTITISAQDFAHNVSPLAQIFATTLSLAPLPTRSVIDPNRPSRPTNLVATHLSGGVIGLSWQRNQADNGVVSIWRQDADGSWHWLRWLLDNSLDATMGNATDTPSFAGLYHYYVHKCNVAPIGYSGVNDYHVAYGGQPLTGPSAPNDLQYICSQNSNVVEVGVPTDTSVSSRPSAPTNVGVSNAGGLVTLTWQKNGNDDQGVSLWRQNTDGNWVWLEWLLDPPQSPVTSATDIPTIPGLYHYYVHKCNVAAAGTLPLNDYHNLFGNNPLYPPPVQLPSSINFVCSQNPEIAEVSVSSIFTPTPTPTPSPSPMPPTPTPPSVSSSPTASTGKFIGIVSDSAGNPLPNISLHIYAEDLSVHRNVTTLSDGSFSVYVPAGNYYFDLLLPADRSDLAKLDPQKSSLSGGETRTMTLRFGAVQKTISGKITLSTGEPVTDAEATAFSLSTNQLVVAPVDAQGMYQLRVGGGAWQVGVRPKGAAQVRWSAPSTNKTIVFLQNTNTESAIVNFSLPVLDATLQVTVADTFGVPVSGVGVVLGVSDADQAFPSTNDVSAKFQKTDANGTVHFTVRAGKYFVRAYVASDAQFINPNEQAVMVGPGEAKMLTVPLFRKSGQFSTLSGTLTLENGAPVDALISAWSENGGFAETRAKQDGTYTLALSQVGAIHVRATKDVGGVPYVSSVMTIYAPADGLPFRSTGYDIVLAKAESALSPSVSVVQAATQTVVAQSKDGAQVTVPAGTLGGAGTVHLQVTPTVEVPSQSAAQFVGSAYDITMKDGNGNTISQFQKEIEVILPYDKVALAKAGIREDALIPGYFDDTVAAWVAIHNYVINKEKSQVVLRVNHFTRFALVAAADITPPDAPRGVSVVRGKAGEVVLSWKNPLSDFDHVKIYRSSQAGKLGTLALNDLVALTARDTNLRKGTYYYTVRAIDPAGNESSNKDQVSVTVLEGGSGSSAATLMRNLRLGTRGEDVRLLQLILTKEGVYHAAATGFFGVVTQKAVVDFQEKYHDEILKPAGLERGTGFVGAGTRLKLNAITF